MVEAELGFELLILLLDRPALMREPDQLLDRRRGRQVDEEVFDARCIPILLAQEPDLGGEPPIAPVVSGRDATPRSGCPRPWYRSHVTRRHARAGNASAKARTASSRVVDDPLRSRPAHPSTRRNMDGGRTGKYGEMTRNPDAYAAASDAAPRKAVTSPNSASASTAVIRRPAARARRIKVSA